MGCWIFMVSVNALIPIAMIVFGTCFSRRAPKTINSLFGYRTTMSMKNRDTWEFAHRYCGRFWKIGGWILLPCSVLPMLPVLGRNNDTVGIVGLVVCTALLIPLIVSVCLTERALKRTFDETGRGR